MTTAVKERPILFSGPMVRAILDGRKTQTRRIIKPQPPCGCVYKINGAQSAACCYAPDLDPMQNGTGNCWVPPTPKSKDHLLPCPYGRPNDRLRISEEVTVKAFCEDWYSVHFAADNLHLERPCDVGLMQKIKDYKTGKLRGVHLPPAYARPTRLEITGVRVERLQDISLKDAIAEGVEWNSSPTRQGNTNPKSAFKHLWESINSEGAWHANPWVWVIEFKRIEQ